MSKQKFSDFLNIAQRNFEEGQGYDEIIDSLAQEKAQLKKDFYIKYSRFIQEGTWTDSNYIDDELYYIDAVRVAATNATPKVSYTINVANLENVDEYSDYKFKVGQKTYIEDPEFFGYKYVDAGGITNIKTPIKKEVIVSQISKNLDNPNDTKVTIKTYRNQYEELFQKIQSTSQTLTYNQGEYTRAANAVQADGTISTNFIEKTFAENTLQLANAVNESVSWDTGSGIEIRNENNPSELIRIISGGIWISSNGENYLRKVLDANGIYPSYIRAGSIRTNLVNIVSGDQDSFKWDGTGITAYATYTSNGVTSVDQNKYVKFNQYGLYACKDERKSLQVTIGPNQVDNASGTTYKARNLNEFLEKSGCKFTDISSSIFANYVEKNFKQLTENTNLYDFLDSYVTEGSSITDKRNNFVTYNNFGTKSYHGLNIPDDSTKFSDFTLFIGDQLKYTNQSDIYSTLSNDVIISVPGPSIDNFLARNNVSESDKIKYIQDNSSFSLTYNGLEIQGNSSLQEDTVRLTANGGIEVFGLTTASSDSKCTFTSDFINSTYERKFNPQGNPYITGDAIPLVSLGRFYDKGQTINDRFYGLRMRTREGRVSISTDNEGKIWSKDKLFVGEEPEVRRVRYCEEITDNKPLRYALELYYGDYTSYQTTISSDILLSTFLSNHNFCFDEFQLFNKTIDMSGWDISTKELKYGETYKIIDVNNQENFSVSFPFFTNLNGLTGTSISPATTDSCWHKFKYSDDLLNSYIVGLNGTPLTVEQNNTLSAINQKLGFTDVILQTSTQESDRRVQWFLDNYNQSIEEFNTLNNLTTTASDSLIQYKTYKYNDRSSHGVAIWCGSTKNYDDSNFIVFKDGSVYINKGYFEGSGTFNGSITATDGRFSGQITVGSNAYIDGSSSAENILKAGEYFKLSQDGTMTAANVSISGDIVATSGNIVELKVGEKSGISSVSNISLWINSVNNQDLTTSVFYVTNSGELHSKSLSLEGQLISRDNAGVNKTEFGVNSSDYAFWAKNLNDSNYYFKVDKAGNVYAKNLTLSNNLLTEGSVALNGILKTGNITIDSNSIHQNSGLWNIQDNGNATFKNIEVNGKISSVVFEENKTSAIGGTLFISPAYTLESLIIGTASESDIRFRLNTNTFSNTQEVKVELPNGNAYTGTIISSTVESSTVYDLSITAQDRPSQLDAGANIISTNMGVGNYIQLTAADSSGPKMVMHSSEVSSDSSIIHHDVYIGNLSNVVTENFGNLEGYGLYGDNVYLSGKLYLPNAGITNIGSDSSSIRIWAGTNAANNNNAPFRVLQDGSLYASKGIFSGEIQASRKSTFSGWIKTAGIVIDDKENDDHFYVAYDGDTESSDFPSVEEKIIDISKDGLSIWEGAFKAYSDYDKNRLYKTVKNQWEEPIPYISAIDNEIEQSSRFYLKELNIGQFTVADSGSIPSLKHSIDNILISNGKIQFGHSEIQPESPYNFKDLEQKTVSSINNLWKRWAISNNEDKLEFTYSNLNNAMSFKQDVQGITQNINGSIKLNGSQYFLTSISSNIVEDIRITGYYQDGIEKGLNLFV